MLTIIKVATLTNFSGRNRRCVINLVQLVTALERLRVMNGNGQLQQSPYQG